MKKSMSILFTVLAIVLIGGVSLAIEGPPGEASGEVISVYGPGDKMSFNVFGPNPADDHTANIPRV